MGYERQEAAQMVADAGAQVRALAALQLRGIDECQGLPRPVQHHLTHGFGRRVGMMQRALFGIFAVFPPTQQTPLKPERLQEAQSHLHVFTINLAGLFDNLAWAFVLRHNLLDRIGDPRRVGMFKAATRRFFTPTLRSYLTTDPIAAWQRDYLTTYRDALAHRIPPYIPPAHMTDDEAARLEALSAQELECVRSQDWGRLEQVRQEQSQLGEPCFVFMHEFSSDREARPVLLHPQLITDCATVAECGDRFFSTWHEPAAGSDQ